MTNYDYVNKVAKLILFKLKNHEQRISFLKTFYPNVNFEDETLCMATQADRTIKGCYKLFKEKGAINIIKIVIEEVEIDMLYKIDALFDNEQLFDDLECFYDDPDTHDEVQHIFRLRQNIRNMITQREETTNVLEKEY